MKVRLNSQTHIICSCLEGMGKNIIHLVLQYLCLAVNNLWGSKYFFEFLGKLDVLIHFSVFRLFFVEFLSILFIVFTCVNVVDCLLDYYMTASLLSFFYNLFTLLYYTRFAGFVTTRLAVVKKKSYL